mmetsp:Transcript_26952/g.41295  ORF Transcript_26952/g.41295 Transcript_26952/m.41295 type:complete len:659 (+) Transcript_26952:140-2116(+)|eukprot:CAMPEP_0195282252 /NCGR_PEP_ID=MMETSP0707-20130614/1209_1 /TAXON_ID=33640 /ORGANISM="Asterionellopsis glacialis, Strain CCMP134" /LENGTH=658 /DNA_ID=CAMNT_0040341209 /DNA_START=109 /DNA_END=2085 /DNA_ORIENTATION=-
MATEKSSLLPGKKKDPLDPFANMNMGAASTKVRKNASISASLRLGGSSSLGTFQFKEPMDVPGMVKSYSISADGSMGFLTPTQLGRQELYEQVPFQAVFGLQKKERLISEAFANFAAEIDVEGAENLTDAEKNLRRSRASMIILDELEFEAAVITTPLVFAVVCAALCQFLVGYNTGVMNAPEAVVFPGHSTGTWSMAVAAFAIGGPLGAIAGGQMADSRGRRGALLIDTWTFLLGGLMQAFALDMYTIIISRFVIGFASGFSSVLVPIYLGELAPPTLRGTLGTLTQFAMVIGILVADLFAFPFATESLWRLLFGITAITALLQLLLSAFLLESPRWLLTRDPNSLKARYIIKQLRGLRYDHEVETEVGYFLVGGAAQQQEKQSQSDVLKELMSHHKLRQFFIACIILQVGQQFCGINAVFYYSTSFFKGVIDNPLVGTTIVGAVNVAATYVALLLMDSCGRKTLILWSSGGMFLSCIVIMMSLLHIFGNVMALVAVNVYVSFFEIGLGPIPWLIVAEMFEAKYVSVAMSVCSQVNWFCNFMIGLSFPYINNALGPYSFGPFAAVLAFIFVFAIYKLPETQGTTPAELTADLVRRKSQSVVYTPNDTETEGAIDAEWRKAMEQIMQEEESEMNSGGYNYGFQEVDQSEEQHVPLSFE